MQLFEDVICDLCKSNNHKEVYNSFQYSNSFGKINIKIVVCQECGFIYQNPQLTTKALDEHYSNNSSGNVFREPMQNSLEFEERKNFLIDIINEFNIKNICDVGGGKGEFLSFLNINSEVEKILIEPSDAILENIDTDIIKIQKKIEDLDSNMKFQLIMCINSFEHFKSPMSVFEKISNILENDGFIFLEVPNTVSPYNTIGDFFSYEHMNHFTHESIFYILKKFNFYPLKICNSKQINTVRVIARKENYRYLDNALNIFSKYESNRANFMKNKIIDTKLNKFSIYGAGEHSKYLIGKFDILGKVDYFIDSDIKKQGKTFFDKLIISPEEIKQKDIINVLISSHDFEYEIYSKLKLMFPYLNLITIYNKY